MNPSTALVPIGISMIQTDLEARFMIQYYVQMPSPTTCDDIQFSPPLKDLRLLSQKTYIDLR